MSERGPSVYIQSTNRLALSVSEGPSHAEYSVEDLYSSLIRFGTSLSYSCVGFCQTGERKKEKKRAGMSIGPIQ